MTALLGGSGQLGCRVTSRKIKPCAWCSAPLPGGSASKYCGQPCYQSGKAQRIEEQRAIAAVTVAGDIDWNAAIARWKTMAEEYWPDANAPSLTAGLRHHKPRETLWTPK